jgi:hypothetical protein
MKNKPPRNSAVILFQVERLYKELQICQNRKNGFFDNFVVRSVPVLQQIYIILFL